MKQCYFSYTSNRNNIPQYLTSFLNASYFLPSIPQSVFCLLRQSNEDADFSYEVHLEVIFLFAALNTFSGRKNCCIHKVFITYLAIFAYDIVYKQISKLTQEAILFHYEAMYS
jgi:hypothetical protein